MIGPLLAAGREADVYALDDRRVLRRYRQEADATREADAMRYLAGLGYPVPAVHEAAGRDMVLERLDGPTMAQALLAAELGLDEAATHLAGLLRRLHDLPPWPGAPAGSVLLHLDLHPENVLLTARGPVVIDWCNARPGEADLDTGLTALILAQVSVDPGHEGSAAAGELLRAFLRVAPGDPVRLLDDVVRHRAWQLDTLTPAEIGLIGAAAERMRACAH